MPSTFLSIASWLAAFSILLNGLLPLAAYAAAPAQQTAMPICSADPHAKAGTPGQAAGHSCGHCCSGGPMPALPGKSDFPTPQGAWAVERPLILSTAIRTYSFQSQAQPRAPPDFFTVSIGS